ncbi:hypothetical protein BDY24DRAFT_130117 [Mrakia frigida]|uniref:uncharacterized protein n=1 Tax=Mrakia frigida TaxID=29902 RepID=UPI003FCC20AB
MSLPSATRFAEILGFVEGRDAPAAAILRMEDLDEIIRLLNAVSFVTRAQDDAFFNSLAALYLPCIVRTFIQSSPNVFSGDERWGIYETSTGRFIETPAFGRFVREHPDEARAMCSRLLNMMAEFPPDLWLVSYTFSSLKRARRKPPLFA